jgi:hypothetical protein
MTDILNIPWNFTKTVNLTLESDLLTKENVYCKLTSDDLSVKYTKLTYNGNTKNIQCSIERNITLNSVQFIDIEIYMNASFNYNFIASLNNQTYLMVPSLLKWKTNRFLNDKNLNVTTDFQIPYRDFNYQVLIKGDTNSSSNVSCLYNFGSFPNCVLPQTYLDSLNMVPLKLNLSLIILHSYTKEFDSVSIEYLIYYKSIEFEMVKPYIISHVERRFSPVKIISVLRYQLNVDLFSFYCNGLIHFF